MEKKGTFEGTCGKPVNLNKKMMKNYENWKENVEIGDFNGKNRKMWKKCDFNGKKCEKTWKKYEKNRENVEKLITLIKKLGKRRNIKRIM